MIDDEFKHVLEELRWQHKRLNVLEDRVYSLAEKIVILQEMLNIKNMEQEINNN